jgi:type I restriction enzyme S subunit
MQAIVDKETATRGRDRKITTIINEELEIGQKDNGTFCYTYPTIEEIRRQGRLEAAIYDREYKRKMLRILNYKHGTETPTEMGFTITPGPSLEIKILGTRIDSYVPRPNFYTLILPTNISEYGTMNLVQYLGTSRKLPLLKLGDIVFGEAGFHKGRSIVLLDSYERCTTNAHGLYVDADLDKSIFFRCIFNWYRGMRLVDIVAVGGSGGHLSPSYFDDFIKIPKFPDSKREAIARMYHNPSPPPGDIATLATFVDWHRRWNVNLGIWELDREMKALQRTLADVQEQIIQGKTVKLPV